MLSNYMQYTMPDHVLHFPPQVNYHSFIYLKLPWLALVRAMAFSDEFRKEEEEGYQETEKQISVDPMSLKQPPPVLPTLIRPRFVSASLPCSAASSPDSSPSPLPESFKKWSNPIQQPHPAFHPSLVRRHSTMQSQNSQCKAGIPLPRSKSCGDGRSSQPSDEFDILSRRHARHTIQLISESRADVGQEMHDPWCTEEEKEEGQLKCGALCLFLPGFAKKKQLRGQMQPPPLRQVRIEEEQENDIDQEKEENKRVASRVASLERFECASWSSAAILDEIEDDGISAYFDLPLELIRGSTDDTDSPVRTAFVFDGENKKGVLKTSKSRSGPRKSHEIRHVRFSTSQPVSYPQSPNSGPATPRLFEPREEFSAALLEAQNAHINF